MRNAGVKCCQEGGNAIDAAVTAAFSLAVAQPRSGNIGGGGFMLYRARAGKYRALDFRERAPGEIRPEQLGALEGLLAHRLGQFPQQIASGP